MLKPRSFSKVSYLDGREAYQCNRLSINEGCLSAASNYGSVVEKGSTMKTREEVLGILRQARPDLNARYQVTRISLFGSYARGEQREDSDIDILIDVDPSIGLRFVTLANELEGLLDSRSSWSPLVRSLRR